MSIETACMCIVQCVVRITYRPMCSLLYTMFLCCIVWMCSPIQRCFLLFVCIGVSMSMHTCVMCIHGASIEPLLHVLFYVYTHVYSFAWRGGKFNYTHNRTYAIPFPLVPWVYAFACVCVWAFLFTSVSADKNWIINEGDESERNTQGKKQHIHILYLESERATCCTRIKLSI